MLKNILENLLKYYIPTIIFNHILKNVALYINFLLLILPNYMGWINKKNHHIMEAVQDHLFQSNLPSSLWTYDLSTTSYLLNRISSSNTHNKFPYELLLNKRHDYHHLRVFGCLCYMWIFLINDINFSPKVQNQFF